MHQFNLEKKKNIFLRDTLIIAYTQYQNKNRILVQFHTCTVSVCICYDIKRSVDIHCKYFSIYLLKFGLYHLWYTVHLRVKLFN